MEKSFSDLFKRFEKQKEVIEGYRMVGGAAPVPCSVSSWAAVSDQAGLPCVPTLDPRPSGWSQPFPDPWSLKLSTWPSLALHQAEARPLDGPGAGGEAQACEQRNRRQGHRGRGGVLVTAGAEAPAAAFWRRTWAQAAPSGALGGGAYRSHAEGDRARDGSGAKQGPSGGDSSWSG